MTIATWVLASMAMFGAGERAAVVEPSTGFIQNEGQWDAEALFASRGPEGTTFLTRDGFRMSGAGGAVFWTFVGADAGVQVEGHDPLAGRHHFFLGRDPTGWRRDVHAFTSVHYRGLYAGVDLVLRRSASGLLEYDLLLSPGADSRAISLQVEGGEVAIGADGGLTVVTEMGRVLHRAPRGIMRNGRGEGRPVTISLRLEGSNIRYDVPCDARGGSLVIDPELLWSSFYGGAGITGGGPLPLRMTTLADGSVIVVGVDSGWQFPAGPNAYDSTKNSTHDAYVLRVSADGSTVLYGSFLGGSDYDAIADLDVCEDGSLVLAGTTYSTDFPVTPGVYQPFVKGSSDGFVLKLSADGSTLDYSTLFGGSAGENLYGLDLDPNGRVMVAGETYSADYPITANAFQRTIFSTATPFLAILTPDAKGLHYSTYYGNGARGRAVHANQDGSVHLVAWAASHDLLGMPVTQGALDATPNGLWDVYIGRFHPETNTVMWGTYLGGEKEEMQYGAAFDEQGHVYVSGDVFSFGYPTTPGAFQTQAPGSISVFAAKLAPDGGSLVWSTYLGGWHWDRGYGMAIEPSGAMLLTGETFSPDFPVTPDAMLASLLSSKTHGFVSKLDPTGSKLLYSTYFSGAEGSIGDEVAAGPGGVAFVSGRALGADFPSTPGTFDPVYDLHAAFLAAFDLCGGTMTPHGSGCAGGASSAPVLAGSGCASPGESMSIGIAQAAPGAVAWLLLGLDDQPVPLKPGCLLEIAPLTPIVVPLAISGAGKAQVDAVLPPSAVPGVIHLQALVFDPAAPWSVAATNALRVEIGF